MKSSLFLIVICITVCFPLPVSQAQAKILHLNATELMHNNGWDDGVAIVTANGLYGTGWWVGRNVMITAGHVVEYHEGRVVTVIHGNFETTGTVIKVDRRRDIAIIRTESMPPNAHIFPLARELRKTETIYVIGYPFELVQLEHDIHRLTTNPRVAEGTIAWIDTDDGIAEITAHTDAGNSGGPVVNQNGEVVGLVSFALIGRASTLYFITISPEITHVLNSVNIQPETSHVNLSQHFNGVKYALLGLGGGIVGSLIVVNTLRGRRR